MFGKKNVLGDALWQSSGSEEKEGYLSESKDQTSFVAQHVADNTDPMKSILRKQLEAQWDWFEKEEGFNPSEVLKEPYGGLLSQDQSEIYPIESSAMPGLIPQLFSRQKKNAPDVVTPIGQKVKHRSAIDGVDENDPTYNYDGYYGVDEGRVIDSAKSKKQVSGLLDITGTAMMTAAPYAGAYHAVPFIMGAGMVGYSTYINPTPIPFSAALLAKAGNKRVAKGVEMMGFIDSIFYPKPKLVDEDMQTSPEWLAP
uniref:Uncharacterized protein n=1 Tax=Magnetococcus massalia (strain MO-1) TaxID=451514 RepID=A0A1S7LI83_MAGMO|nr:protein of unknown function [Candidatus Magnetococcus massalia]